MNVNVIGKRFLANAIKLIFAGALIYWLIHSKKITLEPFVLMTQKFWLIPISLFSCLAIILINNYRWQLLLHGQNIEVSYWDTLKLTFIGLFFNLAMPGSIGGDVLKAYYITKSYPHAKLKVVSSVLVDRIVGLYSVVLIAFFAVLFQWERIRQVPPLHALSIFIFILVGVFSAFFALSFSRRVRRHSTTDKLMDAMPASNLVRKVYNGIHAFRGGQKQFIIGVFLSLISQSQMIFFLYVIARELGFSVDVGTFFFVFPVGFMATAIPISPAGVGVGQVVFLTLFQWYTGAEGTIGPTMITINQVSQAVWSLAGAVFYFMHKTQAKAESTLEAPVA